MIQNPYLLHMCTVILCILIQINILLVEPRNSCETIKGVCLCVYICMSVHDDFKVA